MRRLASPEGRNNSNGRTRYGHTAARDLTSISLKPRNPEAGSLINLSTLRRAGARHFPAYLALARAPSSFYPRRNKGEYNASKWLCGAAGQGRLMLLARRSY